MSIEEVKDYALSDGDIRTILGQDISILTYPDLAQMSSIDECFDSKGRCILLFLTSSPTEGHWCCLLNKRDGIHFFDPYGDSPEKQLKGISKSRLEELDQRQPYLTQLLKGSGRPVFYNTHEFQKEGSTINTCGRWCVVRCLYATKPLSYLKKVIDSSGMSGDDFVSALTANWIKR
jgi:hypothetical protein